jgi:hypothetical protein
MMKRIIDGQFELNVVDLIDMQDYRDLGSDFYGAGSAAIVINRETGRAFLDWIPGDEAIDCGRDIIAGIRDGIIK